MTDRLGQPVIIENKPGASNNIGTEFVVRALADGYTMLLVNPANAINTTLYEKLSFNFTNDIAPVGGLMRVPNILEVNPAVRDKLVDLGGMLMGGTPADFGKIIVEETEKWAKVVKFSGAKPE